MNFKNIIFDWSGTLCNDFRLSYTATKETIRHFGGPHLTITEYRQQFTLPVHLFYEQYLPQVDSKIIDEFYFNHFAPYARRSSLYKGIKGLIKTLSKSRKLAIYSTVKQSLLEELCTEAGVIKCFDQIQGSVWNKESELPVFCEKMSFDKDQTVFIGDMEHDILAAKKAGIQSGAVLYGYHSPERLIKLNPDFSCASVSELKVNLLGE